MWDAYFTETGTPLASYKRSTIDNLNGLKAELNKEVVYATYVILVEKLNSSNIETFRQYGSYLSNGLINEVTADTSLNRETQMKEITVELYSRLKARYDEDVARDITSDKGNIYTQWKQVYDAFVSAGSDTDVNLSDYQKLKVTMYEKANDASTRAFALDEITNINEPMKAQIERNVNSYLRASIWDELYTKALANERVRMNAVLKGDTVAAKSSALTAYLADTVASLGSAGEEVFASISAPALTIGRVLDASGNEINEFLFNIYSTLSFLTGVDVEVIKNYSEIFDPYIEEGLRLALDEYRYDRAGMEYSLREYVTRKTADYVNAIVPHRASDRLYLRELCGKQRT